MASANTASVACVRPIRLDRIIWPARAWRGSRRRHRRMYGRARQENLLIGRRNMHVETLFGDRLQARTSRCVANGGLEANPIGLERIATLLQRSNIAL